MNKLLIPQDIRKLSYQRAINFRKILDTPFPDQIENGQIWSTQALLELPDGRCFETDEPRLIVIVDGSGHPSDAPLEQITAAPVSLFVPQATEFDLILSEDMSSLPFAFMVEVWNETPILKGHLKQFLGSLSDEAITALDNLYATQLVNEDIPSMLKRWVGPQITSENDPRLVFQEAELEAVRFAKMITIW